MSETDDTDDLLLIPPDFFLIDTDIDPRNHNFGPFYGIIDNLVTEVIHLQDRVNTIENISDISLVGSSFDLSYNPPKMSDFRKYNSTDDLYFSHSTQSTPHKISPKLKLNSLPASPNINRFSPKKTYTNRKSPRKLVNHDNNRSDVQGGGEMLLEIDNFLSKVKTIQRYNAARNLEKEFSEKKDSHANDNKEIHDVEEMLKELDLQKQEIENKIRTKEEEIMVKEVSNAKQKTWRCGDNDGSVPDYGMGLKSNSSKSDVNKKTIFVTSPLELPYNSNKSPESSTSSESTQATALYNIKGKEDLLNNPLHSNAVNILNLHKQLEDSIEETINYKKDNKIVSKKPSVEFSKFGLMSLADIWNPNKQDSSVSILQHKLHEEKLRRQHCEVLISELHQRNLELQQKMAVALTVDQAKDNAIGQLKEILEKMSSKLDTCNKDRIELEKEMQVIKTKSVTELEDARKKMEFYEKEAAKALNLAHGNHGKLSSLENKCIELTQELRSIETKFDTVRENYTKEMERNKKLADLLSSKEIELMENKNILQQARQEVSDSKQTIDVCQKEFTAMKEECEKLEHILKTERKQLSSMREQQQLLIDQLEKKIKNEKQLKEEINKSEEQIESKKVELKNFYQGQVELLVQNKLKEFQSQWDKAEQSFKEEIKKKELQVAKNAVSHMQQLTEKCALEIKLMEEKHQEEIKLYQIQIMQYKEEAHSLKTKMEQMQMKRQQQAQQLQNIMESQWNEALRIIASGKSPTPSDQYDQLNSLKSKSYNNLEEVLSQDDQFVDNIKLKPHSSQDFLRFAQKTDESHKRSNDDDSAKVNFDNLHNETPVTSRVALSDNEIQKIVNMLINKVPDTVTNRTDNNSTKQTNSEKTSWQHLDQESQGRKPLQKDGRLGKPPWK